jgi:hypothetical protein
MATTYVNFPESAQRSRSQVVTIAKLGKVTNATVDTGSVTYSVSGENVTVNVSGGTAVRTIKEYKYNASGSYSQIGLPMPDTYYYDDGTYVGYLPKSGSYYQIGTEPGSTIYGYNEDRSATLTWRFEWTGSSWKFQSSWVTPASVTATSGDYSGTLNYSSWKSGTPNYPPNSAADGQSAGYTTTRSVNGTANYSGNISSPDRPIYQQDYYGTAERNVNMYAYNVTLTYSFIRPSNFAWTYSKVSGGNFNITASEWNGLLSKINDFREYKNVSRTSWGYLAGSGQTFTAAAFNEARNAMAIMTASVPATVSAGNIIYASAINQLRDALNSVT